MAQKLQKLDFRAVNFDLPLKLLLPGETIQELLDNFDTLENTILASLSAHDNNPIEYRRSMSDSGKNCVENVARLYVMHEVRSFSGGHVITIDDAFSTEAVDFYPVNDAAEIENLERALQKLFGVDLRDKLNLQFNVDLAHRIHKLVMPNSDQAGTYRQHDAGPNGSTFKYLNPSQIDTEMEVLFAYCSEHYPTIDNRGDAFKLAAVFLERFFLIHPYRDGNGRTGRLVCSVLLLTMGWMKVPLLFNFNTRLTHVRGMTLCRDQYMSALQGARGATPSETVPPSLLAAFLVLVGDRTLRSWSDLFVVSTERRRHRSQSHKEEE